MTTLNLVVTKESCGHIKIQVYSGGVLRRTFHKTLAELKELVGDIEATRSLLNAARSLLNKWTLTTGSAGYVVKKEDDSTTAWTGTPTVDGNGNVSGIDHD